MNKYKLINKTTGEEHLCEKVVVDGWDYYVSDEDLGINKPFWGYCWNWRNKINYFENGLSEYARGRNYLPPNAPKQKIIATNNPSIDIPKVVDEVEKFENEYFKNTSWGSVNPKGHYEALRAGYNKSQETHPYSDEDMVEFNEWCNKNYEFDNRCNHWFHGNGYYTTKELLQLWKEQRTKTLYYE